MPLRVKIAAKLWLFYFLLSIGVVSFFFYSLLVVPLHLLARIWPALNFAPDWAVQKGIRFLMLIQPWFSGRIELDIPRSQGGLLVVSNHRSHLDAFILLSRVPGIRFLAKKSLFEVPGLSLMMRATRQIGVERGQLDAWVKAMETVRRRLLAGETVHVFPEMTRCAPGFEGLQHFALGPFLVAIQEDVTVVPVVFKNTDQVWPKGESGLRFRTPVLAKNLAPIRARQFATAGELQSEVRRQMEEALR